MTNSSQTRDALRRIDSDAAELYKVSRKGRFRVRELADAVASCDAEGALRRQAAEAYPELAAAERALAVELDALHAETGELREAERRAGKLGELWRGMSEEADWRSSRSPGGTSGETAAAPSSPSRP